MRERDTKKRKRERERDKETERQRQRLSPHGDRERERHRDGKRNEAVGVSCQSCQTVSDSLSSFRFYAQMWLENEKVNTAVSPADVKFSARSQITRSQVERFIRSVNRPVTYVTCC